MEFISNQTPETLVVAIIIGSFLLGVIANLIWQNIKNNEEKNENNLPHKDYGEMNTQRAKDEFDMDEDEIKTFMEDLKSQIEEELVDIEKYIKNNDLINLKSSIHKIKGSAVNLGEGGIATLLFDFNHYLAEGKDNKKEIQKMYEDIIYYKNKI